MRRLLALVVIGSLCALGCGSGSSSGSAKGPTGGSPPKQVERNPKGQPPPKIQAKPTPPGKSGKAEK